MCPPMSGPDTCTYPITRWALMSVQHKLYLLHHHMGPPMSGPDTCTYPITTWAH